jgi:hypothetical protein
VIGARRKFSVIDRSRDVWIVGEVVLFIERTIRIRTDRPTILIVGPPFADSRASVVIIPAGEISAPNRGEHVRIQCEIIGFIEGTGIGGMSGSY